ncbi:MAG: response regulator transcription factor [Chloroflexi bacterium]|nr:response regulator transcription factor [Chloroflexota bacterium]
MTIVSPNPALRIGLREMLGRQSDIKVVGETIDLASVNENETDVAAFASVSSVRLLESKPAFPILFLTDDAQTVRSILNSNLQAWGALSLEATEDELAAAIRAAAEGLWVGAPSLIGELFQNFKRKESSNEDSLVEPLTAREAEILQLTAQGLANKQIALTLGVSEHTVKFHLSSLYAKLGTSNRAETVRRGIELGLISL